MSLRADDWDRWRDGRRILLVRTSSQDDARWHGQIAVLSKNRTGLRERDVLVVLWEGDREPSEWAGGGKIPFASGIVRSFPDLQTADWCVALIGCDGGVKAVWNRVVLASELFERIDAMPMGRLEKEERRKKER